MSKNIKYLWAIVALGFLATLTFVLLPFWSVSDSRTIPISSYSSAAEWLDAFKDIERTWKLGAQDSTLEKVDQSCRNLLGDISAADSTYLRCNPDFLACLARLGHGFGEKKDFYLNEKYKIIRNEESNLVFQYELSRADESLSFELSPSCRETYLPRRLYAVGAQPRAAEKEPLIWDNENRNIFIDRDPVSNRDLKNFLSILNFPEYKNLVTETQRQYLEGIVKKENLATAALSLPLSLQQKYCAVWGREILRSEVFDAATFIPFDLEERFPMTVSRSGYPWSKRRTGVFLAQKEPEFTAENCSRAFVYECRGKFKRKSFESLSNSWIGLRMILGHEMESMRNALNPRKNLMFSSHYFPASSTWHELGIRGYWDGEGFDYRNFNFALSDPAEEFRNSFGVSFRCMRQIHRKKEVE